MQTVLAKIPLVMLFLAVYAAGWTVGRHLPADATPPLPELACTIDPLLAEELTRLNDHLARSTAILELWESRQQVGLQEAERRRQRLNLDAIRSPETPKGLDTLPTKGK